MAAKERPILFQGAMVRALLDGSKTQTRRVVKPQPVDHDFGVGGIKPAFVKPQTNDAYIAVGVDVCNKDKFAYLKRTPYGVPGDRLWVRETFATECPGLDEYGRIHYRATSDAVEYDRGQRSDPLTPWAAPSRWKPSIHMPRWASRITLEVTDVRVERVQDISEEDALAEGVDPYECPSGPANPWAKQAFAELWDSINLPRGYGWDTNPWVWAVSFRRLP